MKTKHLSVFKEFSTALAKLWKFGIIHTGSWKGDIGEYLAIKKFHLKRKNVKGYDAVDSKGRKIEIKTFAGKANSPQFGIDTKIKNCDYAILVVLDEKTLLPKVFYKVDYRTIVKNRSNAEKKYKRFDLNSKKLVNLKKNKKIEEYLPD